MTFFIKYDIIIGMKSIYIESSVVSYYTSKLSKDKIINLKQSITKEFWRLIIPKNHGFISDLVNSEIKDGDEEASILRIKAIAHLETLKISPDIIRLARTYLKILNLPQKAYNDSLHIATTCINKIDYLVSWNCSHIANDQTIRKLAEYNQKHKLFLSTLCTPSKLLLEGEINEKR